MSASPISSRPLPPADTSVQRRDVAVSTPALKKPEADTIGAASAPRSMTLREAAGEPDVERRANLVRALLVHVPVADRAAARTAIPAILEAARKTGNTDPNRIGYLLATAQTESDFGANMTETGHSKAWFNSTYGGEDGNRPGSGDGYAYRGRGYVQTTHAGRYAELSHHLGLPDVPALRDGKPVLDAHGQAKMQPALVAHPEKLTEPKLAARALVVGVTHNLFTHNKRAALDTTIPIGKKPGDVDFYHARGIVNGIVEAQARTIAHHAATYAAILDSYRHSVLGAPVRK